MNVARSLFRLLLGARRPTHTGTIAVAGPDAAIEIGRDGFGVPYIAAQSDEDAWFGLGFCHGQDRAGQLEVLVRVVRGTLAEVLGEEGVALDRLSRRLGVRQAARAQLAVAQERLQRQLAAYAAGLNQGLMRGGPKRAHEFTLLGSEPTLWDAGDAQGVITFLCFALASNWDIELVRLKVLEEDGAEALAALDPAYPEWLPVSAPPGELAGPAVDRLAHDLESLNQVIGIGGASNAWVVAGARTASGRPILANDPHLNPTAPPQWYLCRLQTPRWAAAGATFAGIPCIAAGHNGFAAWGLTAGHADNCDLFVEEVGDDGASVREGDGFVACEVRREVIHVKGRPPVVEDVLVTPRGPIVSPAMNGHHRALSLSATWLEPRPYEGFLGVHRIRSAADFRAVFEENSVSAVSIVYADIEGHIAWQLACALPRRKRGFGTLPLPGWEPDVGWEAEGVPHAETPHSVDPPAGFLCTANNQPAPNGDGPFLGVDWLDGYRQAAIAESLAARSDWDLAATWRLQTDVRSLPWREMRAAVLALEPSDEPARDGLERLRAWDGVVGADSVGASVFELFVAEMCQRVVRAKAPRSAQWALGKGFTELLPYNLLITRRLGHLIRLLTTQPEGFFRRGWPTEMAAALAAAVVRLRSEHGPQGGWAWGRVRPLFLAHPFGQKAPLDRVFNRGPYPGWGDASTIAQGAVDLADPTANPVGVPTLRMALDVGAWDNTRFLLLGGQSGNPCSPQYDDMAALWSAEAASFVPIVWSKEAVRARVEKRLTLLPGGPHVTSPGDREYV